MAQTSSKRPLTKHGSSTYFMSTSSIGVLIALTIKQGNARLKIKTKSFSTEWQNLRKTLRLHVRIDTDWLSVLSIKHLL